METGTTNLIYIYGPLTSSWASTCPACPAPPALVAAQGILGRIFWAKGLQGGALEGKVMMAVLLGRSPGRMWISGHTSLRRNFPCCHSCRIWSWFCEGARWIPYTGRWCPSTYVGWHFIINEHLSGKPWSVWHQEFLQRVLRSFLRHWQEQRWWLVEQTQLLSICMSWYKRIPVADKSFWE